MNETNKIDNSDIPKSDVATITPTEVKEAIGPIRRGLMKLTIKELETLEIDLKDVFSIKGLTLNFTWEKLIRLINYIAKKKVLRYDHTFEEAIEIIGIFLA